jgi:hypothetical protein
MSARRIAAHPTPHSRKAMLRFGKRVVIPPMKRLLHMWCMRWANDPMWL